MTAYQWARRRGFARVVRELFMHSQLVRCVPAAPCVAPQRAQPFAGLVGMGAVSASVLQHPSRIGAPDGAGGPAPVESGSPEGWWASIALATGGLGGPVDGAGVVVGTRGGARVSTVAAHRLELAATRLQCAWGCGASFADSESQEAHEARQCPRRDSECPFGCGALLWPAELESHRCAAASATNVG